MEPQVALVTGAASGIGRAAALRFAARGEAVVLADLDPDGLDETARIIGAEAAKVRVRTVRCDVRSDDSVSTAVDVARRAFGRLDHAFNNAGIEQRRATIADCAEDNWDATIDTDLKGIWLSMKHEIALMRASGGCIVNTSSIVGTRGAYGAPAYVAAKHGVIGLTRCAAIEEASHHIRVNAVAPGHIRTPMVERVIDKEPAKEQAYLDNAVLHRLGESAEVADVVAWLCSDASSFVTGEVIAVDGGVLAK